MKIKNEQNVYQFKNAVHMGYMSSQEATNNTESYTTTPRSGPKISPETSRSTLHQSKHTVNNRKTIENTGITIDDEGNVLIAQWKNSKINGRYALFKPLGFNEQSRSKQTGICQFGFMSNSQLCNQNFLFDINGSLAKSQFQNNKIYDKCYIYHKSKVKDTKQKVQCKVLTFQTNSKQNITPKQKNKILIPPIKNIGKGSTSNKQNLPQMQIHSNQLQTLSQFFQNFLKEANQSEVIEYIPFQKISVSQSEYAIGFFRNELSQNKTTKVNQSVSNNFSGFGVLFRNDWPYKYGFFQNGKLNGNGRFYQSELQVLDGLFENDQFIQGFIFDYFKNRTYFGQKLDYKQFQIYQELLSIETTHMLEYKKSQHLKSLDFINNYFNLPSIIYKSPWPYQVAKILEEHNSIRYVINEFKNELDISQIEKKGPLTEDKVEELLIKEMNQSQQTSRVLTSRSKINQVKSLAIKNGINSYLKQLEPSIHQIEAKRDRQLKRSLQQYQQLKSARKQQSATKQRSWNKSKQSSIAKKSKMSTYFKPQLTSRQIYVEDNQKYSQQKSKDFSQLISTYREYQVQKNAILHRQALFQNLKHHKKHKLESRSTMIKLDHKNYVKDLNKTPRKTCNHKTNKTALQLDLIYRMHFKKQKN